VRKQKHQRQGYSVPQDLSTLFMSIQHYNNHMNNVVESWGTIKPCFT
jgi:hypothetical protein